MADLAPDLQARIEQLRPLADDIVAERGISDLSKVGNFLPVALGLRGVGLTYLPAELPGGARLGEAIDKYFADNYRPPAAGLGGLLRRRGGQEAELNAKRRTLEAAYDKVVGQSTAYVAHLTWLDRLDLEQMQVKRRPSLREMYIYGDRAVRERVNQLEELAHEARRRARDQDQKGARPPELLAYVYANEFDPDYLKGLGLLLGYPECCIEAYQADRGADRNVEQRAYEQIRDMQREGRSIDVSAYFVKDFFPCQPDCAPAIATGQLWESAFAALAPELRDVYVGVTWESFELVANYPALINQHRRRLEKGPQQ